MVCWGGCVEGRWNEWGDFYVKVRVENGEGYGEEEVKVEVKEVRGGVM